MYNTPVGAIRQKKSKAEKGFPKNREVFWEGVTVEQVEVFAQLAKTEQVQLAATKGDYADISRKGGEAYGICVYNDFHYCTNRIDCVHKKITPAPKAISVIFII